MDKDPLWRIVLCWGVVITYLTVPLIVFLIFMTGSPSIDEKLKQLHFLRDFYLSITTMLVSLAGLNTFQVIKRNGTQKS